MFVTPAFAAAPAEGQTHTETGVAHDAGTAPAFSRPSIRRPFRPSFCGWF